MRWVLARTLRATAARGVLAAYRTRFVGCHHVPSGGAIIASNHVSYLDPVLLWCGSPRPVHFMAKAELWDVPVVGWMLPRLWSFPVDRGSADRKAIATATRLLREGRLVGIFPEGTRGDPFASGLGAAHEGAAYIAQRTGAPVVPLGVVGTELALPRGARFPRFPRVTFVYGEPIIPSAFSDGTRSERVTAMTAEIMDAIGRMRDRAREIRT